MLVNLIWSMLMFCIYCIKSQSSITLNCLLIHNLFYFLFQVCITCRLHHQHITGPHGCVDGSDVVSRRPWGWVAPARGCTCPQLWPWWRSCSISASRWRRRCAPCPCPATASATRSSTVLSWGCIPCHSSSSSSARGRSSICRRTFSGTSTRAASNACGWERSSSTGITFRLSARMRFVTWWACAR